MKEYTIEQINDIAKKLFDNKKYSDAIKLFSLINDLPVELKPNLAKCYYFTNNPEKALELIEDYIKNQENVNGEILLDKALYLNAVARNDEAYKLLLSIKDDSYKARFNLGWHTLRNNSFVQGFQYLQEGSKLGVWGNEEYYIKNGIIEREKRWDGKTKGNTLAFILEGGLGDQMIFVRWVKHAKKYFENVIVFCDQSLVRMLHEGLDNITVRPFSFLKMIEYDYYVPAMSYPAIASIQSPKDDISFPYIDTYQYYPNFENEVITNISKEMYPDLYDDKKFNIGVKWFGNPQFEHEQFRKFPEDRFINILKNKGNLFSLQLDDDKYNGNPLIPLKPFIKDWKDTYELVYNLDFVVTSCTSIAHLCGAMNKKCFVLVPFVPYFVWANDSNTWYTDNVTVIRQDSYKSWDGAFDKLTEHLEKIC